MKSLVEKIEEVIAPSVSGMGFELVQVKFLDGRKSQNLQIMAERPDGSMTLDYCAAISRQVSAVLDVEDLIANEYRLEISSPGIDRPLVKLADYAAYISHTVKVETALPITGRKRFTGAIQAVEGSDILLNVDGKSTSAARPRSPQWFRCWSLRPVDIAETIRPSPSHAGDRSPAPSVLPG